MKKLLLIPLLLAFIYSPAQEIFLKQNMVTPNEGKKLVDGKTLGTDAYWIPDWQSNSGNDPRVAVINLQASYNIDKIEFYDYQDKGPLVIEISSDNSSYTQVFSGQTSDYQKWKIVRVDKKAQYIRVSQNNHSSIISEVRIFGDRAGDGDDDDDDNDGPTDDGFEMATLDSLNDSTSIVTFYDLAPGKNYSVKLNNRELLTFTTPISGHDTIRPPDTTTYNPAPGTVPFETFAGMCILPDDPLQIASAGGYVRPYILSKWYLYDINNVDPNLKIGDYEMAFSPSWAGGWSQDPFYKSYSDAGISIVPTFKESFMFLTNNSKPDLDNKPWKFSEDGTQPFTHRYTSAYFYQYAARYGSTRVKDNTLLLRADQTRHTGLGYVTWMQLENEWDKWWLGGDSEFSAQEYASYHSAAYDGHMQTITDPDPKVKFGIVTADPTMKVVLGPMAHLDYTKLDAIFAWWDANRSAAPANGFKRYPLEAISFHRYSNTSGPRQRDLNGKGQAPEAFGFYEYAKEFVDYAHAKGLEAWLTEFGYDTHSGSPQGIIPFAGKDTEEIQGEWLMRSYLIFAAAGIDRAAMYMMRDVSDGGDGIFQTSGFTSTQGSGWQPKKSWYYFKTMVDQLKGCTFTSWNESGRNDVYVYQFDHQSDGSKVYAVWSPTANGNSIGAYSLAVDGSSASLTVPTSGIELGITSNLVVSGGNVTIPVSEKVRFVKVTP